MFQYPRLVLCLEPVEMIVGISVVKNLTVQIWDIEGMFNSLTALTCRCRLLHFSAEWMNSHRYDISTHEQLPATCRKCVQEGMVDGAGGPWLRWAKLKRVTAFYAACGATRRHLYGCSPTWSYSGSCSIACWVHLLYSDISNSSN